MTVFFDLKENSKTSTKQIQQVNNNKTRKKIRMHAYLNTTYVDQDNTGCNHYAYFTPNI